MTEYLVVLGVTGAALLAASSDVSLLYDNVRGSYANQSSEMNKVQRYDNQAFRYSEADRPIENDEGDPEDPVVEETPEQQYPPFVEEVYDANGNPIGVIKDGYLLDEQGNQVAICQRDNTGGCIFLDSQGNVIDLLNGASLVTRWVDDQGNELVLQALTSGGQVMGFAYLYNGKYYNATTLKLLNPQPTGLAAVNTRKVLTYDSDGKAFMSGYEANGLIYSASDVLSAEGSHYDRAMSISGELLTVDFATQQPDAAWQRFKPCLVLPHNWSDAIDSGDIVPASIKQQLDRPPAETSFIDADTSSCNGRTRVTRQLNGDWMLTR
ncbi:hypothetical protein DNK34_03580 [Pseudomonas dryadis]|uniref:Uncharacterized protein n=2 Tax=Pseudomonadales TaxID=72274 RepID=A0ABY1ZAV2_9GAMM|nr:hypothetical protein DNK34_03580 [Pseudomonas dryadis]TBV18237.1 hypothetical protein DNK41_09275 [Pseudomonas sp. FRB 230]